jgi:hypothetical protein
MATREQLDRLRARFDRARQIGSFWTVDTIWSALHRTDWPSDLRDEARDFADEAAEYLPCRPHVPDGSTLERGA